MHFCSHSRSSSIAELFALASSNHAIAYADYCYLQVLIVAGMLKSEEREAIQRLFYHIERGFVQLVRPSTTEEVDTLRI